MVTLGTHISDEDRRAATTITTSGSGHKFEIQLGHLCDHTPASWRTEQEISEDRRRRIEIVFAQQNGVRARFVLLAPGRKRSTVGVDFRSADPSGDGGVRAVIDELVALLREVPGPTGPAQVAAARA